MTHFLRHHSFHIDLFPGVGEESLQTEEFDTCMYDGLKSIMTDEVGCTVPWLPDKDNICVKEEERNKAFQAYQKNRRNQVGNGCFTTNRSGLEMTAHQYYFFVCLQYSISIFLFGSYPRMFCTYAYCF